MRKVINIVNFVRGVEPRRKADLITPIIKEIELVKRYGFPNTFLLQYDAMINEEFRDIFLNEKDEQMEIGIWIEIVRPLCEAVNIRWRGRDGFDWDWHVNRGFSQAYTREEKELLIDEMFDKFKKIFGYYPKSAGSWLLDSYSMQYMYEKYDMDAFCICRDQWGTDGYTIWGGYYNQGYYPCKNNMLHPAQSQDEQIGTPIFRMLGSDPIYQYDDGFEENSYNMVKWQNVVTMEPAMGVGQNKDWVEWYLTNIIKNEDLGFSNVQVGQENSFDWNDTERGLPMQLEVLNQLNIKKDIVVEKLCDTGKWFKATYSETPPTVYSALNDWKNENKKSIWYNCKNYRANLFSDNSYTWFRDIHIFNENYVDQYLAKPCKEDGAIYEALPVMDGYKWSKDSIRAGIYFDSRFQIDKSYSEENDLVVNLKSKNGKVCKILFLQDMIKVISEDAIELKFVLSKEVLSAHYIIVDNEIRWNFKGFNYKVIVTDGILEEKETIYIKSIGGKVTLFMNQ